MRPRDRLMALALRFAEAIGGALASVFLLGAIACVVVMCGGCATPLDGVVGALNGTQVALTAANATMGELERADSRDAVLGARDGAQAAAAVDRVHVAWRPKWAAYSKARTAWLVAATLARAAQLTEKAGGKVDPAPLQKAALEAGASLSALSSAARGDQ